MSPHQYRKSHFGDATVISSSYLHIWILTRRHLYYTPHTTKLLGGILVSLRPSVCPSVRPASYVRSVASTDQDGFLPYLVQIINSMRGCIACDDPWPWPIFSRSFGLDLENRDRSVASTILDGLYLYLAQMINIIRGCVACCVFAEYGNLNFWQVFEIFRPWPWKKMYSSRWILSIFSGGGYSQNAGVQLI